MPDASRIAFYTRFKHPGYPVMILNEHRVERKNMVTYHVGNVMKSIYRKLALVLTLTLLLTGFGSSGSHSTAFAAGLPSLRYASKVMYIGGDVTGRYGNTCTVPLQNASGYSVRYDVKGNEGLVTVTSKGKIMATGKGVGTAVVTVTFSAKNKESIVREFNVIIRRNANSVRLTKKTEESLKAPITVGDKIKLEVAKSYDGSYKKGHYGLDNYRKVITDTVKVVSLTPDIAAISGLTLTAKKAGIARFEIRTHQYGDSSLITATSKAYTITVKDKDGDEDNESTPDTVRNPIVGNVSVDDIVQLGGHDWRVLDVQDGKALVLSDRVLEYKNFHTDIFAMPTDGELVTWATSALRQYLNESFYNGTFNDDEKESIIETRVETADNPWFYASGGDATDDRVFLLSLDEVVKYFGDSGMLENNVPNDIRVDALIIGDQYSIRRIAYDYNDQPSQWWLRSTSGWWEGAITYVESGGYISMMGSRASIWGGATNIDDYASIGVRPAMWVNTTTEQETEEPPPDWVRPTPSPPPTPTPSYDNTPDSNVKKIYTASDLNNIKNNLSGSYVLMNDIDLSGFNGGSWVPIGESSPFTGVFDGQGYVIRNLRITGSYQRAGLFAKAENATIKNVGLEGTKINVSFSSAKFNSVFAGGIVATGSNITISNCYNKGEISASSSTSYTESIVGGIVGSGDHGSIINCYNTGNISALTSSDILNTNTMLYAGGIIGISNGLQQTVVISYCYNTGNISSSATSSSSVGGIVGGIGRYATGVPTVIISDCYNTGNMTSSAVYESIIGGIVGLGYGSGSETINNCYNTGNISSSSSSYRSIAGGILGNSNAIININYCNNAGDISSYSTGYYSFGSASHSDSYAGGIVGRGFPIIVNSSYNTGSISSYSLSDKARAGGICGEILEIWETWTSGSSIRKCHNTGNVSASSKAEFSVTAYVGGICGYIYVHSNTAISECYNTGNISASVIFGASTGGICGGIGNSTTISNCYNTGTVVFSSTKFDLNAGSGGICGTVGDSSIISNCYNTGSVSASYAVDDYFSANIINIGGICGLLYNASFINCYWNSDSLQILNDIPVSFKKGIRSQFATNIDTTIPLTTIQMTQQSSFMGFDFNSIWGFISGVNNNYPILK